MSDSHDQTGQSRRPARRPDPGWVALILASTYAGLAWYARDPATAVAVFKLVLVVLAGRPR